MRARKRDAALRSAEPTPSPPAPARTVAAQPSLGTDSAPTADPGNDVLLAPDRQVARSGSEPDVSDLPVERITPHVDADGRQWVAAAPRLTPDEVEAIAQRLAALFLRGA